MGLKVAEIKWFIPKWFIDHALHILCAGGAVVHKIDLQTLRANSLVGGIRHLTNNCNKGAVVKGEGQVVWEQVLQGNLQAVFSALCRKQKLGLAGRGSVWETAEQEQEHEHGEGLQSTQIVSRNG